ncbi:MAG: aldehyde-activating protein [Mesorhizobium sp.]|nr:MAG: aldehyde-activating protein [Mesorhizobium sp.]
MIAAPSPIMRRACCSARSGRSNSPPSEKLSGVTFKIPISNDCAPRSFCPVCGTPVYLTYTAMPEPITVHAASLDDPSRFNPTVVTYGSRALPWDKMDTALKTFEKMPQG